jgi:hypothetical protein
MLTNQEKIHLQNLIDRSRDIIISVCNTIGCADCHLRWNDENGNKGSCSSAELESQIADIQFREYK